MEFRRPYARMRALPAARRWLAALALIPVATAAVAMGDTPAQQRAASRFAATGMAPTLRRCDLPRTCAGAKPSRQDRRQRETGNDFQVDQRTLAFAGLTIELFHLLRSPPPADKAAHPYRDAHLLRLRLSDARWPVAHGFAVGTPRARVVRVLGRGNERGACNEYIDRASEDMATVCFERDRISSIEWVPWNDA